MATLLPQSAKLSGTSEYCIVSHVEFRFLAVGIFDVRRNDCNNCGVVARDDTSWMNAERERPASSLVNIYTLLWTLFYITVTKKDCDALLEGIGLGSCALEGWVK